MSTCDSPRDELMPVERAVKLLLAAAVPQQDIETIALDQALGRVLAQDQSSTINVPAFDNSAMDGYALHLDSLKTSHKLRLAQRIVAGDTAGEALPAGMCARIFTGAPIPPNANAVVMQEQCQLSEEHGKTYVKLPDNVRLRQNIRPLGQDIRANSRVLKQGKKLRAQELGLLASVGIRSIPVFRKLKVAIISTGDELVEPGQPLQNGQIYNSNHYTMRGMLETLGCEVFPFGTLKDDPELIKATLIRAADEADCILTSGGVSVGEEDYVKPVVEALGQLDLWKIAIKPGKPFAFGQINNSRSNTTPLIGLPGNPAAVFVTFHIIAKQFLQKLQGIEPQSSGLVLIKTGFASDKPTIREQYLLVRAIQQPDGQTYLEKYPNQSSGVLSSSSWANGLAKIPAQHIVRKGDLVEFIGFDI